MSDSTLKSEAFKLRRQGKSYAEINKALGIPKSTLSGWFKDFVLTSRAQDRLNARMKEGSRHLIKRNKLQTHEAQKRAKARQKEGRERVPILTKRDLLIVGVCLYWGEGYKRLQIRNGKEVTSHAIAFVNADPEMIRIFVKFIVEVMGVSKSRIKAIMRLYDHINEDEARRYWIKSSGLPKACFCRKTTYLISGASKRKKPFNRLPYGTLQVEVANTEKFHTLLGMIEGVKDSL